MYSKKTNRGINKPEGWSETHIFNICCKLKGKQKKNAKSENKEQEQVQK